MSGSLLALVAALGAGHLAAYYGGRRGIAGGLKALPILGLAWGVVSAGGLGDGRYQTLVVAGLAFSAIGDVSLVFASGFLPGLASFFTAHCCYVAAFLGDGVHLGAASGAALVVLAVVAGAMLRYLWPHVGRVRGPVVVYVVVLTAMVWCAVARGGLPTTREPSGTLAVLGAASFLLSDGVLAVDRFARPFPAAHLVVMLTYYVAQALIAASAV